jgi:hypothetical protein
MLTATELETELRTLLGLAHRLMPPLNHQPHVFHEQKDAFARCIIGLMDRCGFRAPTPRAFSAPTGDSGVRFVRNGGRQIPVERRRAAAS